MHKWVFSTLLLTMFLWASPSYSSYLCAELVTYCRDALGYTRSCISDPAAGQYPGADCSVPGTISNPLCFDFSAQTACCSCVKTTPVWKIGYSGNVRDRPLVAINSPVGLVSVSVYSSENVVIDIPVFERGTLLPIVVTVSKIDPLEPGRFMLRACDTNGCKVFDPVFTVVVRETGKPTEQRFEDIPYEENKVSVYNPTPGVRHLEIEVNGKKFKVNDLRDGESRTIDIASAMASGEQNVVTLRASGKPGRSISVVIHD